MLSVATPSKVVRAIPQSFFPLEVKLHEVNDPISGNELLVDHELAKGISDLRNLRLIEE